MTGRFESRRDFILRTGGAEFAPPSEREVFWRRYNESRRRSALKAERLGTIAAPWIAHESAAIGNVLAKAKRLWSELAPPKFAECCRVDSIKSRRLTILVDSRSTGFVLRRTIERAFLDHARSDAWRLDIDEVIFRVAPRDKAGAPFTKRGKNPPDERSNHSRTFSRRHQSAARCRRGDGSGISHARRL